MFRFDSHSLDVFLTSVFHKLHYLFIAAQKWPDEWNELRFLVYVAIVHCTNVNAYTWWPFLPVCLPSVVHKHTNTVLCPLPCSLLTPCQLCTGLLLSPGILPHKQPPAAMITWRSLGPVLGCRVWPKFR